MSERTTNTFQAGMVMDIDKHLQPNNTYRYALNGRIIFNTNNHLPLNERYTEGVSFAFVTEKGTKKLFEVCNGYICVGSVDLEDECITFWTDGTNCEIRTFKIDALANVYDEYVLFNDLGDPNGDKLNFNPNYYIQGRAVKENENNRRIYFWDNRNWNQPRVVNIELLYRKYTDSGTIKKLPWHWKWNNANPDNPIPIAQPLCNELITYPNWLSVHGFDLNTDLVYPRIKFFRRIVDNTAQSASISILNGDFPVNKRCGLKTGIYQYFVRYVTHDNYKTPISPITNHIFLTSKDKDKNNHHNYTMYASNVATAFGIELIIEGIDTRYDKLEIGYVYSIGKTEPHEVTVFESIPLTPANTTINVQHVHHSGIPLSKDEVNLRYETIMGANTGDTKDNILFLGGIRTLPELKMEVGDVSIQPHFRLMDSDQGTNGNLEPTMIEDVLNTGHPEPATNSTIETDTITFSAFTGETVSFGIEKDYKNYKGMQWEHLLTGFWRGEVYGTGVVILDRKGNPAFVTHIKDYQFPQQFETGFDNISGTNSTNCFNLTQLDTTTGRQNLRLMGMLLSGLKLPKEIVFDKFGKLNISGFMIVRNARANHILHQGLLLNCTFEGNCKKDKDKDYEEEITRPLPGLSNSFFQNFDSGNNDSNKYIGLGRCAKRDKVCKIDYLDIFNRPHTFTYECPDLWVTGETIQHLDSDYIKIVGTCHKAYLNDSIPIGHDGYYAKSYRTNNAENRYPLGFESRIQDSYKFYAREQRKPYDSDNTNLKFTNDIWGFFWMDNNINSTNFLSFPKKDCTPPDSDPLTDDDVAGVDCFPTSGVSGMYYQDASNGNIFTWDGSGYSLIPRTQITEFNAANFSSGHNNTTVLKCKDIMHIDIAENNNSKASYHIVNFLRPNTSYYSDSSASSLEVRKYISTGHYQPITTDVLLKAKKVLLDGSVIAGSTAVDENLIKYYQFDDIEVWGGDCFLQFVDFTRLLPYYHGACDKCNGRLLDYSVSHIVPLECNHNLMMRYGRSFAKCATQPQAVSCNDVDHHFRDGIMDRQPEDWNVNEVMQHQNNLQFYASKPADVKIISDMPTRVYYSLVKTYSELEDRYRKILRLNYHDLEGIYGDITGFINNFGNIYCFQQRSFGYLRINERAAIPTELDAAMLLGTGSTLDGVQYISTIYGSQHRESIIRMNNAIYFADVRMGKFCRFAQDGNTLLSDANSVHDIATLLLPYYEKEKYANNKVVKIIAAPDYENNDVIYTIYNNDSEIVSSYTISMNETLNKYTGFTSATPRIYIAYKNFVFSPNPAFGHEIHIHFKGRRGEFYGTFYKTILRYIVCPTPNIAKVFDNSLINVNIDGSTRIGKITHTTQNQTHVILTKTDHRCKYKEDSLRYPIRELLYKTDRVRSHIMEVEIEIDNADQLLDNKDIASEISSIDTVFRYSYKM